MQPAANSAGGKHLPYEAKHINDFEWETIRWPGETGKMLFHPRRRGFCLECPEIVLRRENIRSATV